VPVLYNDDVHDLSNEEEESMDEKRKTKYAVQVMIMRVKFGFE